MYGDLPTQSPKDLKRRLNSKTLRKGKRRNKDENDFQEEGGINKGKSESVPPSLTTTFLDDLLEIQVKMKRFEKSHFG